jgi:hypothetical protein
MGNLLRPLTEAASSVFSGWAPTVLLSCGGFGAKEAVISATAPPFAPVQPAPAALASVIAADCQALFAESHGKRFTLLWGGKQSSAVRSIPRAKHSQSKGQSLDGVNSVDFPFQSQSGVAHLIWREKWPSQQHLINPSPIDLSQNSFIPTND